MNGSFPLQYVPTVKVLVSGNATLTSQFYVSILFLANEVQCICSMIVLGCF